jgi:hypothetical protein
MTGSRSPFTDETVDADALATLTHGSNVLLSGGTGTETLAFSLSLLADLEGPLAVVSTDWAPDDVVRVSEQALQTVDVSVDIVDCTDPDERSTDSASPPTDTHSRQITVAGPDLPSVGEATIAAIGQHQRGSTPLAGLCLDSVSTLVERASLQQVYKLLYILSERVREQNLVAFYTWNGPTDEKALRILDQTLDECVSIDEVVGVAMDTHGGPTPGDG